MLVEKLLPQARSRLVTVPHDAPLLRAAGLLAPGTDIVAVCDPAGSLEGVVTKSDVVGRMSVCRGASCTAAVSSVMTRDVVCCGPGDRVREIWSAMKERGLKNVPVTGPDREPLGMLSAGDALQVLLREAEDEDALLRDYIMCVGYR